MRYYPSKILLFGEYILLTGATALAMPMPAFSGRWVFDPEKQASPWQEKLSQFAESEQLAAVSGLDAQGFLKDLGDGLVFQSNIPVGYGLGSSGALCAAVYDRYCRQKTDNLNELKLVLAGMESFFHGASSGIDPLTSYVQNTLMIRNKTEVSRVTPVVWENPPLIFLIDSALPRKTEDLVPWFLEKSRHAEFSDKLQQQYLPAHEWMVAAWMEANAAEFWTNLRFVSQFQLENFIPMIPATLQDVWSKSLEDNTVVFKICGAGGGGYMLGFSQSLAPVEALSRQFRIVFPFHSPQKNHD